MFTRIFVIGLVGFLAACVSDQEACRGDWNCVAQRQAHRDRITAIMVMQSQNRPPPLFYAAPPMTSGRLQTICQHTGNATYCN